MPRWADSLARAARRAAATLRNHERNTGPVQRRTAPTARVVSADVRVEYTPHLDGDPDPGEVVWAWIPFEDDPTLGKDRPVVIIGRHGDFLSGVALTSKERNGWVDVGTGDWDSKHRRSYAKVDRLLDVAAHTVRREGSILNRRQFDQVVDAVVRLHTVVR
jgi:PemK-like, MazF-like toxin of type II toxin-antitoxin system